MALNLLANILMVLFMSICFYSVMILFNGVSNPLFEAVMLISFGMVFIFGVSAMNTNVRVKTETIPIVKVTNKHYMIKKGNVVEIHKLPDRYHLTSKKSRIEKTKAIDWYLLSKNQDQIGKSKVYIDNK